MGFGEPAAVGAGIALETAVKNAIPSAMQLPWQRDLVEPRSQAQREQLVRNAQLPLMHRLALLDQPRFQQQGAQFSGRHPASPKSH